MADHEGEPGHPLKRAGILTASMGLMAFTMTARLVGYLRDSLVADRFGASAVTDAFLLAYSVPNFLVGIISGALNSVIVPSVVAERDAGNDDRAWEIIYTSLMWMVLVALLLVVVIGTFAVPIMHVLAPGFSKGQDLLAAHIVQILMGFVFFSVVAYFLGSVLNSEHRFVYAGVAPILASGAAVVVLIAFAHPSIVLVAWALLAGSVMQVLLQLFPLLPEAVRHPFTVHWKDPVVAAMGKRSLPILVSSGSQSGNVIVDRLFGSLLAEGSITSLAFSQRVIQVPNAVFGSAVATVLYPRFAEAERVGARGELARLLGRGIRLTAIMTIPVSAVLITLAHPVVDVLFRHGAFTQADAYTTALCMQGFALTILPTSTNFVLTRAYYTLRRTFYVGASGTATLGLNALADYLLMQVMGAPGIALATALVQGSYMAVLISGLNRELPTFRFTDHLRRLTPLGVAAAIGSLAAILITGPISTVHFGGAILAVAVGTAVLGLVGEAAALVLRVPEAGRVLRRLLRAGAG